MLTVICGENTQASRNYLQSLKTEYKKKNYLISTISVGELEETYKNAQGSMGLFGEDQLFITENLSSKISRKKKTPFLELFDTMVADRNFQLVDWEEGKSAYELTALKKIASGFKEFKPEKGIFQLLDQCYPKNLKGFITGLEKVSKTQDESFIYAMLCKHIRSLVLAKENALGSKMSPWQKQNLMNQARLWDTTKLVGFYEGLGRIDVAVKTSSTPFSLKNSLDILASYYL